MTTERPGSLSTKRRAFRLDHDQVPYLEATLEYAARETPRFHVPGHKGGAGAGPRLLAAFGEGVIRLDIPAFIEGVDIGPDPTPLAQALELAADAWGARRTWFLLNGSSEGAQAACLALARRGASAVVQRNAHVSVINGLILSGLQPTFVPPAVDERLGIGHCVTPESLGEALGRTPGAAAAFVVSPTYFGAAGDVRGLAEVAHAHGAALVVDEAWGAHFAFHDGLPEDALSAGADIVISGTHKMISSLTQSAMLHLGWEAERFVDVAELAAALALLESTSPSSLLFASLDAARRLAAVHGPEMLERTMSDISSARGTLEEIPGVEVLDERLIGAAGVAGFDGLRLTLGVRGTGVGGYALGAAMTAADGIQLELMTEDVLVAHCGMGEDASSHGQILGYALRNAVADVLAAGGRRRRFSRPPVWGPLSLSPREAFLAEHQRVPLEQAVGRVSAESLAPYPPGIPTVLPGERISGGTASYITRTLQLGGRLRGSTDPRAATVLVVRDEAPSSPVASPPIGDQDARVFDEFPARAYLTKYYSTVGPENAALMGTLMDYLAATQAPTDRVIEVAGGPSLFSMLAVAAQRRGPFEHVLFTDLGRENLREVENWLKGEHDRFDYAHLLAWLEERTGTPVDPVCAALRASNWELANFDWKREPPAEWQGSFDVVSSHFFAESATSREEEFIELMRNLPRLGRPGAVVLMSFISRSKGYTVGGVEFPGFGVDETTVLAYLRTAGVALRDLVLRTVPAEDPASDPGYEGLLFVAGRLL